MNLSKRKTTYLYYLSQMVVLSSPFLTLPFLARIVGPAGMGLYGGGQAFSLLISMIVEYGFIMSATRLIARREHDLGFMRGLVKDVLGAKLLLAVVVAPVCFVGFAWVPLTRAHIDIFSMALLFGVSQGFGVYWFFGGTDNLLFVAFSDMAAKTLSVILIFALVRGPDDVWLVFIAQAMAQFAAVGVGTAVIYFRYTGFVLPDVFGGVRLLRVHADIFFQTVMGNFFVGSTALVMGFMAGAEAVGYFSAGERLMRGALLPMAPLRQTFFPTVTAMMASDNSKAIGLIWRILKVVVTLNVFIGLMIFVLAEPIVRIALGAQFSASVTVVRILSILPSILTLSDVLSTLWLLPQHHDRYCTKVVMLTGAIHICSVCLLASFWGQSGAAIAVLISNGTACIAFILKAISVKRTISCPAGNLS